MNILNYYIQVKVFKMDNKDKISDTFLALNYLNLSKNYTISVDKPKLNINMVWDVLQLQEIQNQQGTELEGAPFLINLQQLINIQTNVK